MFVLTLYIYNRQRKPLKTFCFIITLNLSTHLFRSKCRYVRSGKFQIDWKGCCRRIGRGKSRRDLQISGRERLRRIFIFPKGGCLGGEIFLRDSNLSYGDPLFEVILPVSGIFSSTRFLFLWVHFCESCRGCCVCSAYLCHDNVSGPMKYVSRPFKVMSCMDVYMRITISSFIDKRYCICMPPYKSTIFFGFPTLLWGRGSYRETMTTSCFQFL